MLSGDHTVVQPNDRFLDCAAINAEAQANTKRIQELASEEGGKVAQNVAAVLLPLLQARLLVLESCAALVYRTLSQGPTTNARRARRGPRGPSDPRHLGVAQPTWGSRREFFTRPKPQSEYFPSANATKKWPVWGGGGDMNGANPTRGCSACNPMIVMLRR